MRSFMIERPVHDLNCNSSRTSADKQSTIFILKAKDTDRYLEPPKNLET